MIKNIQIGPFEKIENKPFTDLNHSTKDLARLKMMTQQLVDFYERSEYRVSSKSKVPVFRSGSKDSEFKIYYIQPEQLFNLKNLMVVGFFGHRRKNAAIAPLIQADKQFEKVFNNFDGLLSLSTARLPSGDFANLVLFKDDEAKDQWHFNLLHYDTVTKISPPYYESIRLNNGILPKGVRAPGLLRLTKVRYLDYTVSPHWRAVRKIERLPTS